MTVYLITGANRGIGRGLVATYLARPSNVVVAAVRDPSHPTSKSLAELPKDPSSRLIVVKLDSEVQSDAATAVEELGSKHGVSQLDVVIANAGVSDNYSPVAKLPMADLRKHVEVNGYGPILLFQAVLPLLEKSPAPKFVGVGSPIGSIGGMEMRPFPMAAYGVSKAVLHYVLRKIHFEHENIISFAIDPGFVQTDMGNSGAAFFGMKEATTPVDVSVAGIVAAVDGATKEKTSGHFAGFNGEEFPW